MRYCVTGDTLVVTDHGLLPIAQVAPEGSEDICLRVLSKDGALHTASKWWDCGVFPTRRVRTQRGYEITGTTNHPLLTTVPSADDGRPLLVWKTIDQIKAGDYLVLDRSAALWPEQPVDLRPFYPEIPETSRTERHTLPAFLNDDLAFLMGALLAEGTFRDKVIEFTNTPGDFADAFMQAWARVFPTCRLHIFERAPVGYGKKRFLQIQIVSTQVIAFLRRLGLVGRSAERHIPDVILRSPQIVVAAFLRGQFEGDGAVERSGHSLLRVNLCARNRAMLREVQTLLLRFGIVSALWYEAPKDLHRVCITGRVNLAAFAHKIGFVSAGKQGALAVVLGLNTGRALSKTDFVPYLAGYVRAHGQRGHRNWLAKNNFDRTDRLTAVLPRLAEALPAADFIYIEKLAAPNYLFEQVTSVEDAGAQRVYSLRVDSACHSFVANGFVNHNTEARLTHIAEEMLTDLDKDTIDWTENFDGSLKEPAVLPARLPNLLLNGSAGIAVGMATNIPPHNLHEICDAAALLIENPDASIEELMEIVPGPDFPTGGLIMGREGIQSAYSTGRGRIIMRAKAYIEEGRANRFNIIVTELPYQVNKATLAEKIADLINSDKLDGASLVRDESDRSGMRLVIELKREAQPKKVLNQLFKYTSMQSTFGANMLALVDGQEPRVLTLKRMLQHHIEWRHEVITRRTRYELKRARDRAHVLEGLQIALDNLDAVITTIRNSRTVESARNNLRTQFKLTEIQANAILDMRLARLAAMERKKVEDELAEIIKQINYFEDLLAHPAKIYTLIKQDLISLKEKFGDVRRTRIIAEATGDFNEDDLIPEIRVLVTLTDKGYIKRLPHDTYKRQNRGGRGVTGIVTREMDAVQHMITCNTLDSLLFLTNKGRVFTLRAHEVPDATRQAKGLPLVNLINLQPNERVTEMVSVADFEVAGYLVMATKQGKIKRTPLEAYSHVLSSGIIALNLEEGDELAGARVTHGDGTLLLITRQGQGIRFKEEEVRPMGRDATGVNAIRLDPKDYVIGFDVVVPGCHLLVCTDRGVGKRTPLDEFPIQGRAGGGVRAIALTDRSGLVAMARVVDPNDDLVVISNKGLVIRMFATAVSVLRRPAQGVQIMHMRETDGVASIARIPADGDPADKHGAAATHAGQLLDEALGMPTGALAVHPPGAGRQANGAADADDE
ncbi:MAG TPA: DNA gyrase subunit A [Chloroflexia bacterium]|nr:DNA gyrase subunit A [Chloroflexia bacterium]